MKKTEEIKITLKDVKDIYRIIFRDNKLELLDLTDRVVQILKMKWLEFKSFAEISKQLNLSVSRLRQIYIKSIFNIKHGLVSFAQSFKKHNEVIAENLKLKEDIRLITKSYEKLNLIEKETNSLSYCTVFLEHLDQTPVEQMELSNRIICSLKGADIWTLGDIKTKTRRKLLVIRNFGEKSMSELEIY